MQAGVDRDATRGTRERELVHVRTLEERVMHCVYASDCQGAPGLAHGKNVAFCSTKGTTNQVS